MLTLQKEVRCPVEQDGVCVGVQGPRDELQHESLVGISFSWLTDSFEPRPKTRLLILKHFSWKMLKFELYNVKDILVFWKAYQSTFWLGTGQHCHLLNSNFYLRFSKTLWPIKIFFFTFTFLFLVNCIALLISNGSRSSFRRIRKVLELHFPLSNDNRTNRPVLELLI